MYTSFKEKQKFATSLKLEQGHRDIKKSSQNLGSILAYAGMAYNFFLKRT